MTGVALTSRDDDPATKAIADFLTEVLIRCELTLRMPPGDHRRQLHFEFT